ncbi:CoA pyrophosphatase [Polymorphobacter sp.]|uniref:CoA pyrophosphatase n=1 Tax=Polymorphobacter sp. TaxID=1909290 RepID=UPI003F70EBF2
MPIDRLRAALLADTGGAGWRSDRDISGEPEVTDAVLMPAAVLMAVTREAEPQLLLTRRTAHLKRHAGQIAFPGGRVDPGDLSPVMTALREAEEEVALSRHDVEVIGQLDPYVTGTGFSVQPVVGLVPAGLALAAHAYEVAELFHVPLAHVLDPANHELRHGEWRGRRQRYYVIRHGEREIWGATAGMIVNLSRRLL